ncbi:MAG: hypothetical protein AAGC77_00745 [Pseudomonadota bacterium]
MENSFDDQLSCDHLSGEYDNNLRRLEELTGEKSERLANNLGLLLTSPLFLDFSDTIRNEVEAIAARNDRLLMLMSEKDCPPPEPLPREED